MIAHYQSNTVRPCPHSSPPDKFLNVTGLIIWQKSISVLKISIMGGNIQDLKPSFKEISVFDNNKQITHIGNKPDPYNPHIHPEISPYSNKI